MPIHYPSSFNNIKYLSGGSIRLTSWRQAIVPQNTPAYGLNYDRQIGISSNVSDLFPGAVYSVYSTNKNGLARFFMIFNQTTIPNVGQAPSVSFLLPAGTGSAPTEVILGTDFFGQNGIAFTSGIAWGISTSETSFQPTQTPQDHSVQVNYV
jgi:hypothetical protein